MQEVPEEQAKSLDYKGNVVSGPVRDGYEVLGVYMAVLNCHVNDADNRARALMSVIMPKLLPEVEQIERDGNGIMAIFKSKPTDALMLYAGLVTAFVNEKARFERVSVEEVPAHG